jgi:hypothetical protein
VASVLFLNIEGAFLNAVTDHLLHNMRKHHIPEVYVHFMEHLLTGHLTRLHFDDYILEPIEINNGVGQGDPILLISFLFYNSDFLELQMLIITLGFVNDMMILRIGKNFEETTNGIREVMEQESGGLQWAKEHNSKFEMSKLAVMHMEWKKQKLLDGSYTPMSHPPLIIQGKTVKEVQSYKYLGIHIDNKLNWKVHENHTIDKAIKWTLQCCQFAKHKTGLSS